MKLVEVPENLKGQYNHFIASQLSGSFLQSWEWGEWQAALSRQVFRFKILDGSGAQMGLIQLIRMPLPLGKYYLYSPYGPVIPSASDLSTVALAKVEESLKADATDKGSFGSANAALRMTQFLIDEIKFKFPNAIFIRIEPKNLSFIPQPLSLIKSANIQPGKTLIINLTKSEEQLLSEMHHKTRYNIKLAQKHGVEIKDEFEVSAGHGLFYEEALKLILETSKRQKFATFSAAYYEKMTSFFALSHQSEIHLHIYKAIFQNQLLGAAIMVDFGKTRTFLFGGSSAFHKNVMAPYLLHFRAMLDGKNQGLEFYDFWGVETSGGETPGFARFKMGFGGKVITYAGASDIVQNKFWFGVYKILRNTNRIIKKFFK